MIGIFSIENSLFNDVIHICAWEKVLNELKCLLPIIPQRLLTFSHTPQRNLNNIIYSKVIRYIVRIRLAEIEFEILGRKLDLPQNRV